MIVREIGRLLRFRFMRTGRTPDPALSVREKTRAQGPPTPDRKQSMSISAEVSCNKLAPHAQRDRRIGSVVPGAPAWLARAAWQCLALGILAFAASCALSGTTAIAFNGAIWLVLAPLASLLAVHRHRIGGFWDRRPRSARVRRGAAGTRELQARLPRRQASRLRHAA